MKVITNSFKIDGAGLHCVGLFPKLPGKKVVETNVSVIGFKILIKIDSSWTSFCLDLCYF